MQPLESTWVNPPPTVAGVPFVQSQFSPGGNLAPTAQNNYNVALPSYNYNNPYVMAPATPVQAQLTSGNSSILGDVSGLRDAGQFVQNGLQFPQSTFLNNVGTSLGFAPGTVTYGTAFGPSLPGAAQAFGPSLPSTATAVPGSLGTTSTLSSSLGAAGLGALAGNFLGRIGGNATGGSIGGGLGAGIGMAVGGPPGAVIGGLLGGIGGGFFGGKKPATSASEFLGGTGVNADGTLSGVSFGAKNAGQYEGYNQSLSQEFSNYLSKAKGVLGVDFTGTTVRGGVNTRHSPSGQAGYLMVDNKTYGFDPNDPNSRQQAIGQAVADIARQSGASDEQIQQMANQLSYEATPQGQAMKSMPFIPIKDDQRFADFMSKYKVQGTPDANATN